ncbi:MAG: NCS2 family permease [Treponema sp.]|jgi:AGZA family xanthine/uracil permease-like MFS transporter|nr:NCS2 family permease [Treponema sp.]
MEKFFRLKENNTTVKTELIAGLTTFMTMAYILIVNPNILSVTGMDWGAVFTATAVASVLATMMMAFFAKYPFALAPGMGLNAFFAFTVGLVWGWQIALIAVFIEGILFILMSLFKIREAIFDSIPKNLKLAVSAGIGLFIAFIGLVNGGLVVAYIPDVPVTIGDLSSISVILMLAGTVITMIFLGLKIKGALLWGILATWVIGIICQLAGLYVVNPEAGMYSLIPAGIFSLPPSVEGNNVFSAFAHVRNGFGISIFDFIIIIFAFLFVDVFDTIGTVIGVSEKAGFMDKDGKLPRVKQVLLADAVGTFVGAGLGTSTVTTYVESAAGVAEGGRTGLTAFTVAVLFGIALFFAPIFAAIPAFATAPALVLVGFFMLQNVVKIDFADPTEGIPAFLAIVMMPFAYSIADGIVYGVLSYVILKLATGKRKDISIVMIIVAILFVLKLLSKAVLGY